MRIELTDEALEIRLSRWERFFGLMHSIRLARRDVSEVEYVEDPMKLAMGGGMKAGLRIPWLVFVARSLRLDEAFIVRRRQPGLTFAVANNDPLRRVVLSTPEAAELAARLSAR